MYQDKLEEEKDKLDQAKLYADYMESESNRRKNMIFIMLFLILFFISVFGLTYSIYKGTPPDDNEITTSEIIFSYSDADKAGNGIDIRDALPIPDSVGKTLMGNKEYFDFSVTATSKRSDIAYQLLAKKLPSSTLENSKLRIYLVSLTGNFEEEVLLTDFSSLKKEIVNGNEYFLLYEKTLNKGIVNYSDYYRLRMWVKEGSEDYLNKSFSIRVVANAVQVVEDE